MITNVQSLNAKARNFAIENNLSVQQVLQNYMFERFLERLSKSQYKEHFIIKGGLLLSSIMGLNNRTTMDIDADITGIDFKREELENMINNILSINVLDEVEIALEEVEDIIEDNEYGGFKFKLIARFKNLRIPFHIDISTGDIITPKAIKYKYKMMLEDDYIDLYSYNEETIIAEKLQTILNRKIANSRMKDFYDLYYFVAYRWNLIEENILKQAIKNTFAKRETLEDLNNISDIILLLESNKSIKLRWDDYCKKHLYASNIKFEDVIEKLNYLKVRFNEKSTYLNNYNILE